MSKLVKIFSFLENRKLNLRRYADPLITKHSQSQAILSNTALGILFTYSNNTFTKKNQLTE